MTTAREAGISKHMPDVELKPQVYRDPRPEEYFRQFHERARRGDGRLDV